MKVKGFTIIELMATVALAAVVLVIGVPSFSATVANNRMISPLNEFVSAITLARIEAISRRADITMCKSNSGQTDCDTSGDWSQGWIIFIDDNQDGTADASDGDGNVDANETILQVHSELHGNLSLVGSANVANLVIVDSRGFARNYSGDFTLCDTRGADEARGLMISVTARIARTIDTNADGIENKSSGNLSC